MRHHLYCLFVAILGLSASSVHAQEFDPFPDGREITLLRNGSDSDYVFIRVDSTSFEAGNEVLWFNKRMRRSTEPGCDWKVQTPSFLGLKSVILPDSTYVFFNQEGDSIFYYRNHLFDSWRLYTYDDGTYIEGQPWVFVDQSLMPLYRDSIRMIQFVGKLAPGINNIADPWHLRRLGLTEDNGLYRWVDMWRFPAAPDGNDHFWAGISDPDTGYVNLDAGRTFNLQTGDEFHFERESLSGDATVYQRTLDRGKRFVQDRTESMGGQLITLTYFEIIQHIDSFWDSGVLSTAEMLTVDTVTETVDLTDYEFLNAFQYEYHNWNGDGFSEQFADSVFYYRSRKQVYNWYDYSPSDSCLSAVSGPVPEYTFMDGLGLFHLLEPGTGTVGSGASEFERYDIVYYQKRLEQYGTPFDFESIFNGIEVVNDFEFKVFPNPADQIVNVQFEGEAQWRLVDLAGRQLQAGYAQGQVQIDVSDVQPGMYLLQLQSERASGSEKLLIH